MYFSIHGSAELEIQGQIILAKIVGPWNLELIELYQELMKEHLPDVMAQGPWGLIIEISGAALCPPDALELVREGANLHVKQMKRVCTSYVIAPDVEGYRLINPLLYSIYEGLAPCNIVEAREEAIEWTLEQLKLHASQS